MARINTSVFTPTLRTHEGGASVRIPPIAQLRRSVLTCLLWENTFYETGNVIAARIRELVAQCAPDAVAALAVEARDIMQLRHVPLLLVRELARTKGNGPLVYATLRCILQRPDELTEYLAMYWADGRVPVSAASKRALRDALTTFSPYQIAKYRADDKKVKLVDVLRLVRPTPPANLAETFAQLRKGTLTSVDTWETELSGGGDKREVFERLIREEKLGGLATLRNLRNMQTAGVPLDLIRERLAAPMPRVWPYRFVVAAKYAPNLEDALEQAMYRAVADMPTLPGRTLLMVDVSGSMKDPMTVARPTRQYTRTLTTPAVDVTRRMDVAAGLAILLREKAPHLMVTTFSNGLALVPNRRGFALRDAIVQSQPHGGTYLRKAMEAVRQHEMFTGIDRVVVITDEQSADGVLPAWTPHAYIINVASNANGVGDHGGWSKIDGWSERVFDYMHALEQSEG